MYRHMVEVVHIPSHHAEAVVIYIQTPVVQILQCKSGGEEVFSSLLAQGSKWIASDPLR